MNNQNYPGSTAETMVSRSKRRVRSKAPWISIGVFLMLCCLLVAGGTAVYYFFFYAREGGTVVLIHAPQNGESLQMGRVTTVQAVASDPRKISRVELWVDDQLVDTETSNVTGGISSFPLLADWTPSSPGGHTVMVRAFNSLGIRTHSTVRVEVNEFADRDNDSVTDEIDLCPDQSGLDVSNGCPDRDIDGLSDVGDSCPDVAGLPASGGCPAPSAEDRDGDGTPDSADICPDAPGSSLVEGCLDSDGDLVADAEDLCPTEHGSTESDGCPAPDMPGDDVAPADEGGIPPGTGASDRDGDGASDDVDPCPDEVGLPENDFCPPPTEDPAPADDAPVFDIGPFFAQEFVAPAFVEFEALHFEVSSEYYSVWCYAQLAGGEVEQYEFEPGDELSWNIAEVLGGENSVHLAVPREEPLPVFVECYGRTVVDARVHYLGSITREHAPEEWDGHVIYAESRGGESGEHSFKVRYHLCSPNCDANALQPPVITRSTVNGNRIRLYWEWEGDTRSIQGYKLYLNGSFIDLIPPAANSGDVAWRHSGTYCVDRWEFHMTTFQGPHPNTPDIESPPGNSVVWDSVPCMKLIRVTFETINMKNPPGDENGEHKPGPLSGSFVAAAGANMETLGFDAMHCPRFPVPPFEKCFGLKLGEGFHDIQGIFDQIQRARDACTDGLPCHARYYRAPSTNSVVIGVNPGDDLILRSRIMDADALDEDDVLFEGQIAVETSRLEPDMVLTLPIPGDALDVMVKMDLYPFTP